MEVKKDVDVLIKEVAACNTLTAEEDFALTKAVQDKGTDCDETDEGCTGQRYRLRRDEEAARGVRPLCG